MLGVIALLFGFWLYLGYRSFSNEIANANKRLDKRTKAALAPGRKRAHQLPDHADAWAPTAAGRTRSRRAADSILLVRTDPSNT